MGDLFGFPYFKAIDPDGVPYASGRLYFFDPGTTDNKTVYSDSACTTPYTTYQNTEGGALDGKYYVELDSGGLAENIYLLYQYDIIFTDSDSDDTIWSISSYGTEEAAAASTTITNIGLVFLEEGSGNNYQLEKDTGDEDVLELAEGTIVIFKATHTNTGSATITVQDLASYTIKDRNETPLVGGEILDGEYYICAYNYTDTYFQILNVLSGGALAVIGDLSVGGDVAITGDTELTGTLDVGGDATLDGSASIAVDLDVTGDATIGGELTVTGDLTVSTGYTTATPYYIEAREIQTAPTNGQTTYTVNTATTQVFTDLETNIDGVSLTSNVIKNVPAGLYYVKFHGMVRAWSNNSEYGTVNHTSYLYDSTLSAVLRQSMPIQFQFADNIGGPIYMNLMSVIEGYITLDDTTDIIVQRRIQIISQGSTTSFGAEYGNCGPSTYNATNIFNYLLLEKRG